MYLAVSEIKNPPPKANREVYLNILFIKEERYILLPDSYAQVIAGTAATPSAIVKLGTSIFRSFAEENRPKIYVTASESGVELMRSRRGSE